MILSQLKNFQRDERGVVAILAGLVIIPMVIAAGLAIDVARATIATTRLEAALDAAALAAAKGLALQGLSEEEARALAERLFRENMATQDESPLDIQTVDVQVDGDTNRVVVNSRSSLATTLGGLAGINTLVFDRSSAAVFEAKNFEVSVMLDVTGSMCDPCSKIEALKDATKTLVDIVIPDRGNGQEIRVGLAPYSFGVNAGQFAASVTDGRSRDAGNSCTFERVNLNLQNRDITPIRGAALQTFATSFEVCPTTPVEPLTKNKQRLFRTIDGLQTGGATAGHLGIAWAWYVLSPEWDSIFGGASRPASYDDDNTEKFAILMTDGLFNTFGVRVGAPGSREANASAAASRQTCQEMRDRGITIFTVGFQLPNTETEELLQDCASGNERAFLAEDGDALEAAFRSIAEEIVTLRLTN